MSRQVITCVARFQSARVGLDKDALYLKNMLLEKIEKLKKYKITVF